MKRLVYFVPQVGVISVSSVHMTLGDIQIISIYFILLVTKYTTAVSESKKLLSKCYFHFLGDICRITLSICYLIDAMETLFGVWNNILQELHVNVLNACHCEHPTI